MQKIEIEERMDPEIEIKIRGWRQRESSQKEKKLETTTSNSPYFWCKLKRPINKVCVLIMLWIIKTSVIELTGSWSILMKVRSERSTVWVWRFMVAIEEKPGQWELSWGPQMGPQSSPSLNLNFEFELKFKPEFMFEFKFKIELEIEFELEW